MATSYLKREGKYNKEVVAATDGGVANANAIPALDANGRLTAAMMPAGVAPDADTLQAAEPLKAGDFVNIFLDTTAGAARVRKAVATGVGFEAKGYVTADVATGGQATVFFDDNNAAVTSAPIGDLFLSATKPGGFTDTPPTGAGVLSQCLGTAVTASVIHVSIERPTVLAQ